MDNNIQTSFIPKKPIVEDSKISSSSVSLFLVVAIIIFLVSLSLMAWVTFTKTNLINQIKENKAIIEKNKGEFEAGTIESILRLDSRIKVVQSLIDNHVVVSPIFNFLEQRTLKSIRFKNFKFYNSGKAADGSDIVKVEMSGQAKDFKTIALQANEFGKIEYRDSIKEPVFSDLNLTADASVSFSFSAYVIPKFISYRDNIK
jgi:hypothetical protein